MADLLSREPQTIGGVLDQGFRLARAAYLPTLPINALAALAGGLTAAASFFPLLEGGGLSMSDHSPGVIALTSLLELAFGLLSLLAGAAVTCRVWEIASGAAAPSVALVQAGRRLPALIGTFVLIGLPVVLALLLGAGLGFFAVSAALGGPHSGQATALVSALIVAFFVALVVLTQWITRTIVAHAEALIDGAGPVAAVKSSWQLTRGQIWRISVVFLAVTAIVFATYLLAGLIGGLVARGLAGAVRDRASDAVVLSRIASLIATLIVPLLVTTLTTAISLSLWHDLKLRAQAAGSATAAT